MMAKEKLKNTWMPTTKKRQWLARLSSELMARIDTQKGVEVVLDHQMIGVIIQESPKIIEE